MWLSPLDKAIHEHIWELVKQFWEPNDVLGHGVEHAQRIYSNGIHIALKENANPFVVGAACYFVDSGLTKHDGRKNHIKRSLLIADRVMKKIPRLADFRKLIIKSILYHEAENDLIDGLPIEVLVVRDSDTLDRLGMTGIKMTLTYGVWASRYLCNLEDPFCVHRPPSLDDFTMDYISYLFSLSNRISTKTAKLISCSKIEEMKAYCESFLKLLNKLHTPSYNDAFLLLDNLNLGENP